MDQLSGRVAVVTGAASGIGLALARRLGAEGMRVVLADIEAGALERAAKQLAAAGVEALAVRCDVSRAEDVDALARRALDAFGTVHLVCNNAGVFVGGNSWEVPIADWNWVLGVNFWGVVHGLRSFVPLLLAHGEDAHIVNTASMAGLVSLPFTAPYCVSKHAVVTLSESLHHELTLRGGKVGVSVLCPEVVATNIGDCARNRPAGAGRAAAETPEQALVRGALEKSIEQGVAPEAIAERVLRAVRERRFYVLAEGDWRRAAELRLDDVRQARNPTLAPPQG
jgi:NAD(P)-dependent dehydrogenase (short-subunit alcohol dehydrogenase family)